MQSNNAVSDVFLLHPGSTMMISSLLFRAWKMTHCLWQIWLKLDNPIFLLWPSILKELGRILTTRFCKWWLLGWELLFKEKILTMTDHWFGVTEMCGSSFLQKKLHWWFLAALLILTWCMLPSWAASRHRKMPASHRLTTMVPFRLGPDICSNNTVQY